MTGIDNGEGHELWPPERHNRAAAVLEFIAGHVFAQDALDPGHERDIAQWIALISADVGGACTAITARSADADGERAVAAWLVCAGADALRARRAFAPAERAEQIRDVHAHLVGVQMCQPAWRPAIQIAFVNGALGRLADAAMPIMTADPTAHGPVPRFQHALIEAVAATPSEPTADSAHRADRDEPPDPSRTRHGHSRKSPTRPPARPSGCTPAARSACPTIRDSRQTCGATPRQAAARATGSTSRWPTTPGRYRRACGLGGRETRQLIAPPQRPARPAPPPAGLVDRPDRPPARPRARDRPRLPARPHRRKAKRRKASYAGTCERCGAPTSGADGKGRASRHCQRCKPQSRPRWTREAVRGAHRFWRERFGFVASSVDWSGTHARRRGGDALERYRPRAGRRSR